VRLRLRFDRRLARDAQYLLDGLLLVLIVWFLLVVVHIL